MTWSDSERDYLWKVVADPNVVAMYARNPGKALVSDADGNVVQRARGRPAGVTGSVYKDIVAYALPGYLAKFSERLPGETSLEFAQRTKMRKVHSLTTRRMVEETEDDWRKRLDRPTLNKRLYQFFQNVSPNRVAQVKLGRLTMPPAVQPLDRPLTPFEVFKSSGTVSVQDSAAGTSTGRFRIADWNVDTQAAFRNLSAEEMAALENTTREVNEIRHAELAPELLKLTRQTKVEGLPKKIQETWDHFTAETEFRAVTIFGGVGTDGQVVTTILHNVRDHQNRTFVEHLCERLGLPIDRFRIEAELFFQNVFQPLLYPEAAVDAQPEHNTGEVEGITEVDVDMTLPISNSRAEAADSIEGLQTQPMDTDDARSELSYVDPLEWAQRVSAVGPEEGIVDNSRDMDAESEEPMSPIVDRMDTLVDRPPAAAEILQDNHGSEVDNRMDTLVNSPLPVAETPQNNRDSEVDSMEADTDPAPAAADNSAAERAKAIAAELGGSLAIIAQAALTGDWTQLEEIAARKIHGDTTQTTPIVPPTGGQQAVSQSRKKKSKKVRAASRRAQSSTIAAHASITRKPLRARATRGGQSVVNTTALPIIDQAGPRRSGRTPKPKAAGTGDYDDVVKRQNDARTK
ncbi:hypothetical protein BDW22DRAFT_1430600 [Trametopsis cervina]|nr:hypothetical protein BDW22DRAFT_1430600 [Trametopsis cervina]